ncbi:MAG: hypothetical protein ACRC8K_18580 [Waterburya sp.]
MRINQIPDDKKLTIKLEELAKQAYFDYGTVTDHKNYQGLPMPEWDDLPEKIKEAWIMAVKSVLAGIKIQSLG